MFSYLLIFVQSVLIFLYFLTFVIYVFSLYFLISLSRGINFIDFSQIATFWFHWFFPLYFIFYFYFFYSGIYYILFPHSLGFICSLFPVSLVEAALLGLRHPFFSDIDISCYQFPLNISWLTRTHFDRLVFIFTLVKVLSNFHFVVFLWPMDYFLELSLTIVSKYLRFFF